MEISKEYHVCNKCKNKSAKFARSDDGFLAEVCKSCGKNSIIDRGDR